MYNTKGVLHINAICGTKVLLQHVSFKYEHACSPNDRHIESMHITQKFSLSSFINFVLNTLKFTEY